MNKAQRYRLTATALYPDGTEGVIFAEAKASDQVEVFVDMGQMVAEWMPPERHADENGIPDAIDLSLSWESDPHLQT